MTTSTSRPSPRRAPRTLLLAGAVVGIMTLSACDGDIDISWDDESIDGSGALTTETYTVSSFDEIEVCCDLDVRIVIEEGSDKSVEITIDDNLHSYLDIEVNDGDLEIKPQKNTHLETTGEVVVTVSGYEINGLNVDTASNVSGNFPATDTFTVTADTAADVDIEVSTQHLEVNADTAADVTVAGTANSLLVSADTGADVHLTAVDGVVDAEVNADTAANIEVEASGTITGDADTSADIHVWGNPTIDISTDTDGKVHREE